MSTERITVSLPPELVAQARGAVASGAAESVSSYVAEAMSSRRDKAKALADLGAVTGGRPPVAVLNEVRAQLGLPPLPST